MTQVCWDGKVFRERKVVDTRVIYSWSTVLDDKPFLREELTRHPNWWYTLPEEITNEVREQ